MGVALLLGPYLLEFFTSDPRRFSMLPWYLFGSPMVLSTSNHQAIAAAETVVTVWVILSGIAAAPWIIGQWLRFAGRENRGGGGSRERESSPSPANQWDEWELWD